MRACEVLAGSVDVAFVQGAGHPYGEVKYSVVDAAVELETTGAAPTGDADFQGLYSAKRVVDDD